MTFQKKIRFKKKQLTVNIGKDLNCPPEIPDGKTNDDLSYNLWRFCAWSCKGYGAIDSGQCGVPNFANQEGADITTGNPKDFCTPTNLNNQKPFKLRGKGDNTDGLYDCCQTTIPRPPGPPGPAPPPAPSKPRYCLSAN